MGSRAAVPESANDPAGRNAANVEELSRATGPARSAPSCFCNSIAVNRSSAACSSGAGFIRRKLRGLFETAPAGLSRRRTEKAIYVFSGNAASKQDLSRVLSQGRRRRTRTRIHLRAVDRKFGDSDGSLSIDVDIHQHPVQPDLRVHDNILVPRDPRTEDVFAFELHDPFCGASFPERRVQQVLHFQTVGNSGSGRGEPRIAHTSSGRPSTSHRRSHLPLMYAATMIHPSAVWNASFGAEYGAARPMDSGSLRSRR